MATFLFHSVRVSLGVIFIYASIEKILSPDIFAQAVFNYQIIPESFVNLTAIILPWLELMVGASLIIGYWIPGATLIVTNLLMIFISASLFNLVRGLDVHCGCFSGGILETASSRLAILRDTFFLVMSSYLLYRVFFQKKSDFDPNKFKGPLIT